MLSRMIKDGVHVGYVITCRNHLNAGEDPTKYECKKALTFGKEGLSDEEVIFRLKSWFILGNDASAPTAASEPWETGQHRYYHVFRLGGTRLCELASDETSLPTHGVPDEQLNIMCAGIG